MNLNKDRMRLNEKWKKARNKRVNSSQYKSLTIQEFDKAARQFDNDDPSIYNMCHKDYPDILEEISKEPFEVLLDAGCGTGAMLRLFEKDIPGKAYYGIDLSGEMIRVAKENSSTIDFRQGDCEALPFSDESFDVITCSMSFHHYPNVEKFFSNVYRTLKPNGRFVLRDMTSKSRVVLWAINHIELPICNRIAHKGDVHCYSLDEVRALCCDYGLKPELIEVRRGMRLHAVMRKVKK